MKKHLVLFSAAASLLLGVGCNKDKGPREVTVNDLEGKWSVYENLNSDGTVQPASVSQELSYLNFRTSGTFTEYDYYYNEEFSWKYSLKDNVISTQDGTQGVRWTISDFRGDTFTLSENGYAVRLRRSDNVPRLFLEPSVSFGATTAQIKREERRTLLQETTTGLSYEGSNAIEKGAAYLLENGRMTSAAVLLSLSVDVNKLSTFLTNWYKMLGEADNLLVFESRDGKYDLIVGIDASGVWIIYEPANPSKTAGDVIGAGRRTFLDFKRRAGRE